VPFEAVICKTMNHFLRVLNNIMSQRYRLSRWPISTASFRLSFSTGTNFPRIDSVRGKFRMDTPLVIYFLRTDCRCLILSG
jgi:hypothetical protein